MKVPATATYLVGLALLVLVQPYLTATLGGVVFLVLAVPYLVLLIFLRAWLRDGRMRVSAQEIFLIGLIPLAIAQPYAERAFAGVEMVLLGVAYLVVCASPPCGSTIGPVLGRRILVRRPALRALHRAHNAVSNPQNPRGGGGRSKGPPNVASRAPNQRPSNKALHQTRREGVPASRAIVEARLAGEGRCYADGVDER